MHFSSLISKMLMFTLAISYLTMSNLPLFVDLISQVLCKLFFIASDFTFTTRHIHKWASFLLWPHSWIRALWQRELYNSMKLWTIQSRVTQNRWVIAKGSDQKNGPLEEEMQITPVLLLLEPHEQYEKAKRHDTGRWAPQVRRFPICYWGRVEGNY